MSNEKILEIFYTQIIPEAQTGRIDCYFTTNLAFNLTIDNEIITNKETPTYEGTIIPTLKVTNKALFDKLLVDYVRKSVEFYDPSNFSFLKDIDNPYIPNLSQEEKITYLIKYIICSLFANMTYEDFNDPTAFLKDRIAMFDNRFIEQEGEIELGYLESINARMYIEEEKSPIKAETPYRIKSSLVFDDGYKLDLPEIYAGRGIKSNKIYGVQKKAKSDEEKEWAYLKQIRHGMIAKINGAPEHYFLAIMLFISLCRDEKIEVIPFLIERWNAKRIALIRKSKREPFVSANDLECMQNILQNKVTNTILRYFTKLEDVTSGIDLEAFPYEIDSNMHIKIHEEIDSRSKVFNELFSMQRKSDKQLKKV